MSGYGERKSRAVGLNDKAFGGAGLNLSLDAVMGEGDMITVFDDFNGRVDVEGFGDSAFWDILGWVLTEDAGVTPVSDQVGMNSGLDCNSCISLDPGTADNSGGQLMLDPVGGALPTISGHAAPVMYIPRNGYVRTGGVGGGLDPADNTTWVFACRVGLQSGDTTSGNWDSRVYVGWHRSTSALVHDSDLLTTSTAPCGFHFLTDGSLRGLAKRTNGESEVEGTSWTELLPAGSADGTLANGASAIGDTMWFELAVRMQIDDASSTTDNGSVRFFHRGPTNIPATVNPGSSQFTNPGEGYIPWIEHPTALINATPTLNADYFPCIEVINGPTGGNDCIVYLDWWTMGRSRIRG